MPCRSCGFDGMDAPSGALASDYCERCGIALPVGTLAALFLDKLKLLAQFGLVSNTRLLLGTSRPDS